jgi:glycosyltransferase involved in cell wall biosynthesis
MKNPKISIIIPCYNAEKWIEKCVESALNQTYENIEVIVIDNESKDSSYEKIKDLKNRYSSLKIGSAPNLYKYSWQEPVAEAMKFCTGEYFTILGSDDYIDPNYIFKISQILSKAPQIKIMQSPLMGFDDNSKAFTNTLSHSYKNLSEFKNILFEKSPVITPTVVYKKSLYDEGKIIWESEKWAGSGDYNCYFNLANMGIFIYPYPKWLGYYYRWHSGQSTWGMHKNYSDIDEKLRNYWKNKWGLE